MNETTNASKLVDRLEVKFTNYAIDNFNPSFKFEDEGGKYTKDQITARLTEVGPTLKGLKLNYYREKKTKYFMLSYWLNKKSLTLSCGLFRKDVYGVEEVTEYLKPIVKACTNERGHWVTDPKQWLIDEFIKKEKKEAEEIKRQEEENKLKQTINKMIEMVCADNFPKVKEKGNLSQNNLRVNCLFFLGYNERTKHLIFTEDNNGNGLIKFKEGPNAPQNFTELFKMYPPGTGIIEYDPQLNRNGERSLYDSPLGLTPILELLPGDVEYYLNKKDRSKGYKDNLLDAFSHLWSYARQHKDRPLGRTPPLNPCRKRDGGITIKKEQTSKYKGAYLNDLSFTKDDIKRIKKKLWEGVSRFTFRALALLLIMYSGKRETETLKIKKSDISYGKGEIKLRLTKTRKPEIVDFNSDIVKVLNKIEELKKENSTKYRFVQWLFPSPRINSKKLHSDEDYRLHQTRLKRLDTCMAWLKKELNIPGSMKTFRKAFDTNAIHEGGLNTEETSAVSGQSKETIDRNYNKPGREIRKKLAKRIHLKVFNS